MTATTGPNIIPLDNPDHPGLEPYRNQKDAWLRVQEQGGTGLGGLFMAEGEIVVRELFDSRYPVHSVLITPTRLLSMRDAIGRLPPGTPVYLVPRGLAEGIVGFDMHRGVLALGSRGNPISVRELATTARCLLVLEGLSNHDNIGSLYRSLSALGIAPAGVLLGPGCADPYYRKSLRVSMGHVLRLPTAQAQHWPGVLHDLGEMGYEVLALTPDANAEPIDSIALPTPPARPALVVGAEGPGLSQVAMEVCGRRVRIPMNAGVDSLNVAVAAAVALSWLCRPPGAGEHRPAGGV